MRKTHFKIAKPDGSTEEVKISGLFKYNNRLWVIHKLIGYDMFNCSDYSTGIGITGTESYEYKNSKSWAMNRIDKNKSFDFSQFKVINQPN